MNLSSAPWRMMVALVAVATSVSASPFEPLFQLVNQKGVCLVRKPGDAAFAPAGKNKAYPFGTSVSTPRDGGATIQLSPDDYVQMDPGTMATPAAATNAEGKVIRLERGRLMTSMADNNAPDALVIETPVASCSALSGRGDVRLTTEADAIVLSAVASSGGSMKIAGPQFTIPLLKAGFSVRITTTRDRAQTRILNTVGDYTVLIDNGTAQPPAIETSTRATIRIWREYAPIGGRLIVSVFATGSDGKGKECFAFAVGQPSVAASTLVNVETPEASTNPPPAEAEAPADQAKPADPGAGTLPF